MRCINSIGRLLVGGEDKAGGPASVRRRMLLCGGLVLLVLLGGAVQGEAVPRGAVEGAGHAPRSVQYAAAEFGSAAEFGAVVAPMSAPAADSSRVQQLLSETGGTVWSIGGGVLAALLVIVCTLYTSWGLVYVLDTFAERSAEHRLLYKRLVPVVRLALWGIAVYVIIVVIFGLGAQELVAAATAIGVAVGFAAQDLLKNVFGGIVILIDQPFQVGDRINVLDTYGEVVSIGLRSTRIVTPSDNFVTVPNAQIINEQVSNANAGDIDCQVVTDLYLPHTADEFRAEELAFEAATNSAFTYLDKPVEVVANEVLKETPYLHLRVKAYVLDTRHERKLRSDVTKRARRAFREEGLLTPEWKASALSRLADAE